VTWEKSRSYSCPYQLDERRLVVRSDDDLVRDTRIDEHSEQHLRRGAVVQAEQANSSQVADREWFGLRGPRGCDHDFKRHLEERLDGELLVSCGRRGG
jgi:hypothetical protein